MTSQPRCRAKGGPSHCTDPNCPQKRAAMAEFYGGVQPVAAARAVVTDQTPTATMVNRASKERQHEALGKLMDFGSVVYTRGDGFAYEAKMPPSVEEIQYVDLNANGGASEPVAPNGWEYLKGFTGQYGYDGAVMHDSEFVSGGLADHILANPGYYVTVVIEGLPDDVDNDAETQPVGWGVLHRAPVSS